MPRYTPSNRSINESASNPRAGSAVSSMARRRRSAMASTSPHSGKSECGCHSATPPPGCQGRALPVPRCRTVPASAADTTRPWPDGRCGPVGAGSISRPPPRPGAPTRGGPSRFPPSPGQLHLGSTPHLHGFGYPFGDYRSTHEQNTVRPRLSPGCSVPMLFPPGADSLLTAMCPPYVAYSTTCPHCAFRRG